MGKHALYRSFSPKNVRLEILDQTVTISFYYPALFSEDNLERKSLFIPKLVRIIFIFTLLLYVQEVVAQPKILNRTILSNIIHVTYNYFAL